MLVNTAEQRDAWKVYLTARIAKNEAMLSDSPDLSIVKRTVLKDQIDSDKRKISELINFFK